MSLLNMTKLSPIQLAEIRKREFLTDEFWIKFKIELDECNSFRKTLKGKPTPEQIYHLQENKYNIRFLKRLLYGSEFMND